MSTDRRKKPTYQEGSKGLISPYNRPRNQINYSFVFDIFAYKTCLTSVKGKIFKDRKGHIVCSNRDADELL